MYWPVVGAVIVSALPCSAVILKLPALLIVASPLTVVKVGTPAPFASRIWPDVPLACPTAVVPVPYRTALLVSVVRPVPPLPTLSVPVR